MKQKGSALVIILILILLTVIGFFVYRDYLSPKGTILGPFVPSPTATADPTADWKTYTDVGKSFSLKYPSTWTTKGPVNADDPTIVYIYSDEQIGGGSEPFQYYLWISKTNTIPNAQLTQGLLNSYSTYKTDQIPSRSGALTYFITDDKKRYIEISLTPYNSNKTAAFPSQDKYEAIFDQILSTFKFTGSTTSGPEVTSPVSNSKIASPLTVTGTVPAGWMFEGVFPIKLVDANQKLTVQGQAKETVAGSWQSGNPVDFTATLTFKGAIGSGFLILQNDNPSGDPANSKTFEVPVSF